MLERFPLKSKSSSRKDYLKDKDQVWLCTDYNRQRCSFGSSTHQKNVKGYLSGLKLGSSNLILQSLNPCFCQEKISQTCIRL